MPGCTPCAVSRAPGAGCWRSARSARRPRGAGASGGDRRGVWLERAILLLAGALTVFTAWLIVQLLLTLRALQANPMLVPRIGPGLFVALAGGVLMVASALPRVRGGTSRQARGQV